MNALSHPPGRYVRRLARQLSRAAGSLILPLAPCSCWVTGEPLHPSSCGLSEAVRRRLAELSIQPYCRRCGASLGDWAPDAATARCARCFTRGLGVDLLVRGGELVAPLNKLIYDIKFHRRWELTHLLSPMLAGAIEKAILQRPAPNLVEPSAGNIIVPLPLHWRRRFWRGFNQAEEIAAEVGDILHWPVYDCLRRLRHTTPQATTDSATARAENMKGAFGFVHHPAMLSAVAGQTVWLVDDICTTGSTLHAAAAVLRKLPPENRPRQINAAIVAVTPLQAAANRSSGDSTGTGF